MSAPDTKTLAVVFEGKQVSAVMWRGRAAWIARQLGEALGYAEGRTLLGKIAGEWAEEFIPGTDFDTITNGVLASFREVCMETTQTSVDPRTPSLVILYESGLNLALLLTKRPAGRKLRRILASEVLPQLRATGTATLPGAPAPALPPPAAPKQLPAPRTSPTPRAPKRLNEHPRWAELRSWAQMASVHRPSIAPTYYDLAGEFVVPAALVLAPALIDDLAEVAMRHFGHTGKR